jgi:hypothetical protein
MLYSSIDSKQGENYMGALTHFFNVLINTVKPFSGNPVLISAVMVGVMWLALMGWRKSIDNPFKKSAGQFLFQLCAMLALVGWLISDDIRHHQPTQIIAMKAAIYLGGMSPTFFLMRRNVRKRYPRLW